MAQGESKIIIMNTMERKKFLLPEDDERPWDLLDLEIGFALYNMDTTPSSGTIVIKEKVGLGEKYN